MPFFGVPIRNGVPIGLGSVAGFGISPFDPSQLFSAGEQGALYDPSDLSTMFNDAAGTQPITSFTTNQPVGLLLDKSKGLVLGSQLANAATQTLVTATGTQFGAGWNVTATGAFAILRQTSVLTANTWYKVRFKWSGNTNARTIRFYVGGSGGTSSIYTAGTGASGDVTFYTTTGTQNTSAYFQINDSANGDTFYLEITSVQALPGNHATASGSARPVLSKRYNLLTRTEEFENAAWVKASSAITQNAGIAPNGTLTADKLYPSTTGSNRFIYQLTSLASGLYKWSVRAKAAEKSILYIDFTGAGTTQAFFDLASGAVGSVAAGYTASISSLGNGWYECAGTNNSAAAYSFGGVYGVADANGSTAVTANGTSGIYIWGADLRRTIDANAFQPAYQRVVTATDYDGDGFLPYLEYSGAQAMATGSIDFTAGDKMSVWAGVTKLSDASRNILFETGNGTTLAGVFILDNAGSPGFSYRMQLAGSSYLARYTITPNSPITNVLQYSMDIGGTTQDKELSARYNSVLQTLTTQSGATTAGTGNFGNYPMYVGARAASSLFFTGRQYSLIVRGAQSSDAQISATESWVAQRTGVSM